MKPFGREKKIKGCGKWKVDHHIHSGNKKVRNWWDVFDTIVSRSTMKQRLKQHSNDTERT